MIYSHDSSNGNSEDKFSFTLDKDFITLNCKVYFSGSIHESSVTFNFNESKGKVIQADMVNLLNSGDVIIRQLYSIADTSLDGVDARFNPKPLARFSLSDDGSDGIFHIFGHVENPPEGITLIERNIETIGIASFMSEQSPFFNETFLKYQSKKKVTDNSDIRNSIAYLEAQVDSLTRIILSLVSDDSEARRILAKADESSILDIKSEDKLMKEFENKKNVRSLQQDFYASVNQINALSQ